MKHQNLFKTGILLVIVILINSPLVKSQPEMPGFSVNRGFYETSFDLVVSSPVEGAVIKYTTDCSDPVTSPTAQTQNSPAVIQINPDISYGVRGKTPGVIIRACTVAPDNSVSLSVTHTYLFINKIAELSPDGQKPGTGWPNPTTSGQWINYGMDPDILNDARYADLIDDALLAIPSISIATDFRNLFHPDSGIYVNAMQDGRDWERLTSVELLNPDGTEGFQINAGIRIRGGWSRHPENPKHAFRLFFRSEYGYGKLNYPLFGNEGVDEFDKIDLRTSQNYSWSYPGHMGEYNTMNRDVFSRDLQGKMNQPYSRSRYYHLYINGYYWGLFQSQERPEARYAESYFGGDQEDYDVVKAGFPDYTLEATDGNLDAYRDIWDLCVSGFSSNENYFMLQGRNSDGSLNPSYRNLADIDNFIDYMLIIFYAGNFDSPVSKFSGDTNPNNFFCIYNRNQNDGFKFFIHDAEHTLRTTGGEGPGTGLYENRVSISMSVTSSSKFHPQWLHYKLTSNEEYRLRFADHVYKHFFNFGVMTPQKATALFQSRANEIALAIIGESARWGDVYMDGTKERWQWAVDDIIDNYFPYRTGIVLDQLKDANLYPEIDPPIFKNNDQAILHEKLKIEPGFKLKMVNSNGTTGTILYTTDNSDPREIGGNISVSAMDGQDETEITADQTTIVKARIKDGSTWSALHKIILSTGDELQDLKITEIHYHPLDSISATDTIDDTEYEFLELKNTGITQISLSGAAFVEGITYTFPFDAVIEPNSFIVLASNGDEFFNRYGFHPYGDFIGHLSNGGETLTLVTGGSDTVFSVTFSDNLPWPQSADGGGYSLVPKEINPAGDLNNPDNWRASYNIHGSPGRDDIITSVDDKIFIPTSTELFQNYPNPFNPATNFRFRVAKTGLVTLKIFDVLGNEIAALINKELSPGEYQAQFSADDYQLTSGVYFFRLQAPDKTITRKMLLLK